jgi:hypothetical protein
VQKESTCPAKSCQVEVHGCVLETKDGKSAQLDIADFFQTQIKKTEPGSKEYDTLVNSCHAATEQFYRACDASHWSALDETRNYIVGKIKKGVSQLKSNKTTPITSELASCLVGRENADFQTFRLNKNACTDLSSHAVGLFQVNPALIKQLLRQGKCAEMQSLYSNFFKGTALAERSIGCNPDLDYSDDRNAEYHKKILYSKMSSDELVQVAIGLTALDYSIEANNGNVMKGISDWLVGANGSNSKEAKEQVARIQHQIGGCESCLKNNPGDVCCYNMTNREGCEKAKERAGQ